MIPFILTLLAFQSIINIPPIKYITIQTFCNILYRYIILIATSTKPSNHCYCIQCPLSVGVTFSQGCHIFCYSWRAPIPCQPFPLSLSWVASEKMGDGNGRISSILAWCHFHCDHHHVISKPHADNLSFIWRSTCLYWGKQTAYKLSNFKKEWTPTTTAKKKATDPSQLNFNCNKQVSSRSKEQYTGKNVTEKILMSFSTPTPSKLGVIIQNFHSFLY